MYKVQDNDDVVEKKKMNIITINTSDYMRLYGYDKKKVENLQSLDKKIYLFCHTQSYTVNGLMGPNNHYAYLQQQNEIIPNALDYSKVFNNYKTELYVV